MPHPEREKEAEPSYPPRGWAGKNPQTYHSLMAAMNFLTTLVGLAVMGHYASKWLEKPWIEWLALSWGLFGGLFFLLRRLNALEKRYKDKK